MYLDTEIMPQKNTRRDESVYLTNLLANSIIHGLLIHRRGTLYIWIHESWTWNFTFARSPILKGC